MKKVLFVFICAIFNIVAYSQAPKLDKLDRPLYQGKLSNDDFFNNADYIFEGKIVSWGESYLGTKDKKKYYTSIIKISEVYKGNLDTGTITLVSKVLQFDNGFDNGDKNIYFCKKNEFEIVNNIPQTKNNVLISLLSDALFGGLYFSKDPSYNFEIYGMNHLYFKSKKDFYTFMSTQKGAKVTAEG